MSDSSSRSTATSAPTDKPAVNVVTKQKSGAPARDVAKTGVSETVAVGDKAGIVEPVPFETASETPPPAPDPVVETPVAAALSHNAATVQTILDEYAQVMSPPIMTQSGINLGIQLLARATLVATTSEEDDTRDVMWDFHVTHKDRLMREDMALRGIRTLQGKQASLVSTTYTLFRHKVVKSGMAVNDEKAIELTSRRLVIYLGTKN